MINQTTIDGRLVADVELKQANNGMSICRFTIAQNRRNGETDKTLFLDCTAFKRTAETISAQCRKGDLIVVSGRLDMDEFARRDGTKQRKITLIVNEASFVFSRERVAAAPAPFTAPDDTAAFVPVEGFADGDLPF